MPIPNFLDRDSIKRASELGSLRVSLLEDSKRARKAEGGDAASEDRDETGKESGEITEIDADEGPGWRPSGSKLKDYLYFCGPGWLVSIAYVDPGNYQADIQAGATTGYRLLWTIWWTSVLSLFVQIMCVRLGLYTEHTLAEIQGRDFRLQKCDWKRYVAWFIAEFSVMITDLPEVIGIGIALNLFFGWAYWIGVVLSMVTTMLFLATAQFGIRVIEIIIVVMVGLMSIALFVEMGLLKPPVTEILEGWVYGFVDTTAADIFTIAGIMGAVVMPHNLYLHSATIQERKIDRTHPTALNDCVKYCSWEPAFPIFVSFFVNMAVVTIAAQSVYQQVDEKVANTAGLTNICTFFKSLGSVGCILWGIALLSAGQSSAITTTYTGQYVMEGFLKLNIGMRVRAIGTRIITIIPCVILAAIYPNGTALNVMVNIVNTALSILLPFALFPLAKYNCSPRLMGEHAILGWKKWVVYFLVILVWIVNALTLSVPGGGCFGDITASLTNTGERVFLIIIQVVFQGLYAWWLFSNLFSEFKEDDPNDPIEW
jgi:natural resistance-associated macrophage protein